MLLLTMTFLPWLSHLSQFSRFHFAVQTADVDEGVSDQFGCQLTRIWNCLATRPCFAGRGHGVITTLRKGKSSAQPLSSWKPQSLGPVQYMANS